MLFFKDNWRKIPNDTLLFLVQLPAIQLFTAFLEQNK